MAYDAEVIVSTYNNPFALNLSLASLHKQSRSDFSICIADDGSDKSTETLLSAWKEKFNERLRHTWQPDNGFQKNRILNTSILNSKAQYLIFIDGDCLAAPNFVDRHLQLASERTFCTGGVVRLSLSTSAEIDSKLIESGVIFSEHWLKSKKVTTSASNWLKANLAPSWLGHKLETISPVKRTWNGGNSSAWRKDLLLINGFDERLRYGAEDIELGYRLNNNGIFGRHLRYSAALLHLEHSRNYAEIGRASCRERV